MSQPGYSGNYTVKVEGVPSVYYGRYGSDVPLTTFTQYGNGTNTLRVKPNMLGPNPLKITVTDTDGHSAEIITSVMGIKTTADLQPTFSTSGGLALCYRGIFAARSGRPDRESDGQCRHIFFRWGRDKKAVYRNGED